MAVTNLTVRQVSVIVREYFDEIKKSKFIFDVVSVGFDSDEGLWKVTCELANVFDEKLRHYQIEVEDDNGEILSVHESG